MSERLGTTAGRAAEGERPSGLALAKCEGLPRDMLGSGRIPEHVFERMDFLWRASNCLSLTSPAVSRSYSDQLRKLCAHHEAICPGDGPLLPEYVSDSLCSSCGAVLTPGLNCRVRVRHRSLASPSVKRAKSKIHGKKKAKCLNEVVTTCLLCGGINARAGTERRAHDKKRRRRGSAENGHGAGFPWGNGETQAGNKRTRVATNLRGNFIPLGRETTSARVSASTSSSAKTKKFSHKINSVHPDVIVRSNRKVDDRESGRKRRGGEAESGSRIGFTSRGCIGPSAPHAGPAAVTATVGGRQAEDGSGGNQNAAGDAACAVSGGGDGEAPPPALSLLERIRRDAKRKRREDAAAAVAYNDQR
eukprot:g10426.t1